MWSRTDILLPPNTQGIVLSVCMEPIVWDAWQHFTKLIHAFEACPAGLNWPPPTYHCFIAGQEELCVFIPLDSWFLVCSATDKGQVFMGPSSRGFYKPLCCGKMSLSWNWFFASSHSWGTKCFWFQGIQDELWQKVIHVSLQLYLYSLFFKLFIKFDKTKWSNITGN